MILNLADHYEGAFVWQCRCSLALKSMPIAVNCMYIGGILITFSPEGNGVWHNVNNAVHVVVIIIVLTIQPNWREIATNQGSFPGNG